MLNVQLKRDYSASVRKQLDRFPVWEPGAPFALGDYGVLRDKTLHKLGNIHAFGITFSKASGNETPYQFQSEGTKLIEAHGSGSVDLHALGSPLRSSLELRFDQEQGIFIKAQRSRVIQISELRQVALRLRTSGMWNFRWKLVTEVREVNPATVIMGSKAGTTLKIEGEADLLEQFSIGGLEAGAAITFTGEAALQIVGIEGSLLLDLCYLPRFFKGDIKHAAAPVSMLPEEPYVRLRTQASVADDEVEDDP